jgi:hypothetical protein
MESLPRWRPGRKDIEQPLRSHDEKRLGCPTLLNIRLYQIGEFRTSLADWWFGMFDFSLLDEHQEPSNRYTYLQQSPTTLLIGGLEHSFYFSIYWGQESQLTDELHDFSEG